MSDVIRREFDLFFRDEDEAILRASEYLNSDRPKLVDRKIVVAAGTMAAVLTSISYVLRYVFAVASEGRAGSGSSIAVAAIVVVAIAFLRPKWQADAARKYIRETFGSPTMKQK